MFHPDADDWRLQISVIEMEGTDSCLGDGLVSECVVTIPVPAGLRQLRGKEPNGSILFGIPPPAEGALGVHFVIDAWVPTGFR